ncbi:MAG: hypothetical protein AB7E72_13570 [Lysobacterales bacterium]
MTALNCTETVSEPHGPYQILVGAAGRAKTRGRFEIVRLNRPGRRLDASMQARVIDCFARTTDALYQADTSFHWRSRTDYFGTLDVLWAVFLDRQLVGFTGIRTLHGAGERIVYIDNMNVHPVPHKVFGRHTIGSMLVHEILWATVPLAGPPMSVVFRTQNPSVYRLAYAIHPTAVYPRVMQAQPRDEARSKRVVDFLAATLSPDKVFENDISVIRNAYGGHIYGRPESSPASLKPALAKYWKEHVRLEAGDAVLISVCPTHAEVRGIVWRYLKALARSTFTRWLAALTESRRAGRETSL